MIYLLLIPLFFILFVFLKNKYNENCPSIFGKYWLKSNYIISLNLEDFQEEIQQLYQNFNQLNKNLLPEKEYLLIENKCKDLKDRVEQLEGLQIAIIAIRDRILENNKIENIEEKKQIYTFWKKQFYEDIISFLLLTENYYFQKEKIQEKINEYMQSSTILQSNS